MTKKSRKKLRKKIENNQTSKNQRLRIKYLKKNILARNVWLGRPIPHDIRCGQLSMDLIRSDKMVDINCFQFLMQRACGFQFGIWRIGWGFGTSAIGRSFSGNKRRWDWRNSDRGPIREEQYLSFNSS